MIGYKINIYMEIKNVVSWHDMVVSRHNTVVSWHDTVISCYERVHYITMQTLVRLQQHNNTTTSYSLQIKSQHNNKTTHQPPTAVKSKKLLSLREEEEFSMVIQFCYSFAALFT